ncbi:MAG: Hsp20/alpha crystallin family protein [Halioglobus sp.]
MNKTRFYGSLLCAFAVGGGAMWAWQHYQASPTAEPVAAVAAPVASPVVAIATQPAPQLMPNPSTAMQDPFGSMQDIHRQMEAMHQRMQAFLNQDDFFGQSGIVPGFGSGIAAAQAGFDTVLQEGEDDHSVFYTMELGNQDVSNVNVKVENGYVSINADLSEQSSNSYAHSSLSQTFPVPAGVNPDSAKVEKEKDAIVIRFDKVS